MPVKEIVLIYMEQVPESMDSRKATFLASREWQAVPFVTHAPSDMQNLLSYAAALPSLLEQFDSLPDQHHMDRVMPSRRLYDSFKEMLTALDGW